MGRTFKLSAGVYMIVRSLRLLPETSEFKHYKRRNYSLLTFDRVGLDELCTVHKQRIGDSFPRRYRFG